MITLDDIRAARARIAGGVRVTPMFQATLAREPIAPGAELWLKLECLQVTGSFKARGAMSKLRALPEEAVRRGLVTAEHPRGAWTDVGTPERLQALQAG